VPYFLIILFFAGVLHANSQKTILYINGDYASINYHLGVLSEIERLQIRVDSVVATGWGSFVGALWSSGWSSRQIRGLVESWDSLPREPESQNFALWQRRLLVKHDKDGTPILKAITEKPYFGEEIFRMRLQESYWRSDVGARVAFREVDSTEAYPFPPLSSGFRIYSTLTALRDTNGTAAERYQKNLWNEDSSLIILRPHSKPHPDSLFRAGTQAVQNKRSVLAALSTPRPVATPLQEGNFYQETPIPPPRFLYYPVFDSVPSELQGHVESFWNKSDTGSLAVTNFLKALQKDDYYRDVKLTLDTSSFLQINVENDPILSLSLQGIGGTVFGANVLAGVNFRYVNQFGYDIGLNVFYGQGIKGFVPGARFERFFAKDGSFFIKLKLMEYKPISYFQNRFDIKSQLLKEVSNAAILGIEKPFGEGVITTAVEIERKEITSGASGYPVYDDYENCYVLSPGFNLDEIDWLDEDQNLPFEDCERKPTGYVYEKVSVSSMFPYAKWLWQSDGYDRWFSASGFMAELMGGFKAVSVRSMNQDAPLYVSTSGKINITKPLSKYVSVMSGTEFGFNFRRNKDGIFVLPNVLYGKYGEQGGPDEALENRYRFAMGMGVSQENWQRRGNASHRYGLLLSGLSLHVNESGLFAVAGYAKDGEPNYHSLNLGSHRIFAEPKVRIKTSVFDFIAGQSILYYISAVEPKEKLKKSFFMEFRGSF